jgi:hypothetical protein
MTTPDPLAAATQKIIDDITAYYADAQKSNTVPDLWELVGLAVQFIEKPIPGVAKLTGAQKMAAVKQIVAGVIHQLPIPETTKAYLQQTLFKVENLVEVSLELLERNQQLQKGCMSCLSSTAKTLHIPFPVINTE